MSKTYLRCCDETVDGIYLECPKCGTDLIKLNGIDKKYQQDECVCRNPGEDDGDTTCWVHHDCSDGSCTHQE